MQYVTSTEACGARHRHSSLVAVSSQDLKQRAGSQICYPHSPGQLWFSSGSERLQPSIAMQQRWCSTSGETLAMGLLKVSMIGHDEVAVVVMILDPHDMK